MFLSLELKQRMMSIEERNWRGIHPESEIYLDPEVKTESRLSEFKEIWKKLALLLEIKAGQNILDLGCGFGYFEMAISGPISVYGVDPDRDEIHIAAELCKDKAGRSFINSCGESLPFLTDSFDRVVTFSVLEHVADLDSVLKEIRRVLKPGGLLYIGVPNYLRFHESHYKLPFFPKMNRFLAKIYLACLGKKTEFLDTLHYLTPLFLRRKLLDAGFSIRIDAIQSAQDKFQTLCEQPDVPERYRIKIWIIKALRLPKTVKKLLARGFAVSNVFLAQK